MINYALEVVGRMKGGSSLQEVLGFEKEARKLTYQIMMEVYFRSIELTLV